MKKLLSIFLFSLLISQLSCSFGSKIRGRVYDTQNKPVENAEVTFLTFKQDRSGITPGQKITSRTNANGEFEVQIGKTQKDEKLGLVATKEGYKREIISLKVEELKKFDEVFQDYNIFLKRDE